MPPKTFCTIALLSCCCCLRTFAQQPSQQPSQQSSQPRDTTTPAKINEPAKIDTLPNTSANIDTLCSIPSKIDTLPQKSTHPSNTRPPRKIGRYLVLTAMTGGTVLPTGNSNGGVLNVSFPYTVNGSGDSVFHSRNTRPYSHAKVFLLPVGMEFGNLHTFINVNIGFSLIGEFTAGYNLSIGYGYNFYLNGKHTSPIAGKGFVIKPSIGLSLTYDGGDNADAGLGGLSNNNKTVNAFGKTSGPDFTTTSSDYYVFGTVTSTSTHNTNTLDVEYVQHEFSLTPRITITNNQYSKGKGPHWELTLGYNIPLVDWGGIAFEQDDGNKHYNALAGSVALGHSGLSANYNGHPITSTPFSFPGPYFNFTMALPVFGR